MQIPRRSPWPLRGVFALLVACIGLAVAASLAPAAVTPTAMGEPVIGSPKPGTQIVRSWKDDKANGGETATCSSGTFDTSLFVQGSLRGVYYTLQELDFCGHIGTSNVQIGSATHSCAGTRGALTGLRVDHGYYIKDFQLRCGTLTASSERGWEVVSDGYDGKWLLHVEDPDDNQTDLECEPNQIVTGVRIGYYRESYPTSFTRVQLYCSTVSSAHLSLTKVDPTKTTRVATTTAATVTATLPRAGKTVARPPLPTPATTTAPRLPQPKSQPKAGPSTQTTAKSAGGAKLPKP